MYNANNYGYNPYGAYIPQRQMPQPIQQNPTIDTMNPTMSLPTKPMLSGKQVDSIDVVKATDIGLTGETHYFPLTDNSAIVTKQLQMDGTSKIIVYKPVANEVKEAPKYLVADDLDDLKEEINDIKQEIKDLRKSKKKKDDDNE